MICHILSIAAAQTGRARERFETVGFDRQFIFRVPRNSSAKHTLPAGLRPALKFLLFPAANAGPHPLQREIRSVNTVAKVRNSSAGYLLESRAPRSPAAAETTPRNDTGARRATTLRTNVG
ncbi:MAG: hypothetical protein ACRD4Y_04285 [Candidatus Acidiferrales bacterium]